MKTRLETIMLEALKEVRDMLEEVKEYGPLNGCECQALLRTLWAIEQVEGGAS